MATAVIPKNYDELVRHYAAFIANEIRRANTVTTNFEDAYQDVLMRLIQARVIERFHERSVDHPPTMTGVEAAAFLGVTFNAFRARLRFFHQGQARKGRDRYVGPNPMPLPIQGTICQKMAVYRGEDIINIAHLSWRRTSVCIVKETPAPTPYQFMNYLGMAVRNHFANFCRTRGRRWQDKTADMVGGGSDIEVQFRTADGGYNTHWEDTLRDDQAEGMLSASVEVGRIFTKLEERGLTGEVQKSVTFYLDKGYTLVEAIEESSLTKTQKRAFVQVCARELHLTL